MQRVKKKIKVSYQWNQASAKKKNTSLCARALVTEVQTSWHLLIYIYLWVTLEKSVRTCVFVCTRNGNEHCALPLPALWDIGFVCIYSICRGKIYSLNIVYRFTNASASRARALVLFTPNVIYCFALSLSLSCLAAMQTSNIKVAFIRLFVCTSATYIYVRFCCSDSTKMSGFRVGACQRNWILFAGIKIRNRCL